MSIIVNYEDKQFEVRFDKDDLISQAKKLRTFEKNTYTEFEGDEEFPITEEQFNNNVDEFISKIELACTENYVGRVVRYIKKKKNGTFYKGRKEVVAYYGNTIFFTEWHNTWGTFELRYSVVSDMVIELQIVSYNHTPC